MKKGRGSALEFTVVSAVCLVSLLSCAVKNSGRILERQALFSLEYGAYGKSLNFTAQGDVLLDFDAKEGIFQILDIPGRKVVRLSSYGDILSELYDPEGSKAPEFVQEKPGAGKDSAASPGRYAAIARMIAPTLVAIDSAQIMYLADKPATSASGGNIVRRFGAQGKELASIGQEGPDGTPFKKIARLEILDDNSLVILSTTSEGYLLYRFSNEGALLSVLKMDSSGPALPVSTGYKANIDGISFTAKNGLFEIALKIDLYGETFEKKGGASSGYDAAESWLVALDGTSGRQIGLFRVWTKASNMLDPILLGRRTGQYVFIQADEGGSGFALLTLDGKGKTRGRYRMELPEDTKLVSALKLLQGNRLTGIVGGKDSAQVLWWSLP